LPKVYYSVAYGVTNEESGRVVNIAFNGAACVDGLVAQARWEVLAEVLPEGVDLEEKWNTLYGIDDAFEACNGATAQRTLDLGRKSAVTEQL
jgi:hypothetical protein